ncbi:UNVERIFIED_CONTAM: Cytochrome c oxidase subunit 3, partial [Trichonephila clavipes]
AQPFHLVTPSPWPLLTSFTLLILTSGTVIYFNGYSNPLESVAPSFFGTNGGGLLLVIIGFVTTASCMTLWFRDVVTEGTFLGDHTFPVQRGITIGVGLFILTYLHSSLAPAVEIGSQWPPAGIPVINAFELPLLNTILLLSSGATVTYAHHSLIQGNRRGTILGLIITLSFAVLFTACQGIEYSNAGFTIADGVYGSTFFFSTGFHGIHVLIGTIFILVAFFRIISYHVTDMHHLGFEGSILYWHFVDVV